VFSFALSLALGLFVPNLPASAVASGVAIVVCFAPEEDCAASAPLLADDRRSRLSLDARDVAHPRRAGRSRARDTGRSGGKHRCRWFTAASTGSGADRKGVPRDRAVRSPKVGDVMGASLGWNSNSRGAEACLVSRGRRCRAPVGCVCAVGSAPTARYCVRRGASKRRAGMYSHSDFASSKCNINRLAPCSYFELSMSTCFDCEKISYCVLYDFDSARRTRKQTQVVDIEESLPPPATRDAPARMALPPPKHYAPPRATAAGRRRRG
jgi:hypothetical protein